MEEPVSTHSQPLTRPSVPSIAMVRTVFSPAEGGGGGGRGDHINTLDHRE